MSSSRRVRRLATFMFVMGFAGPGLAQIPSDPFELKYSYPTGEALWINTFDQIGKVECGDVTGDLLADAATLVNGRPFFFYGVDAYTGFIPIESPTVPSAYANDLTLASTEAPFQDSVLVASTRGIERYRLDSNDTWAYSLLAADGLWEGSKIVVSGDYCGGPAADAVFVGPNRRRVGGIVNVNGASPSTPFTLFEINVDILALVPCDFTGNGVTDFALLTAGGVQVRSAVGAVLFSADGYNAGDRLRRIRQSGYGADRLLLVRNQTGVPHLLVLDLLGAHPPIGVGPEVISDLEVGDFNGDGLDDVVISYRGSQSLRQLLNTGNLDHTFVSEEVVEIGLGAGGDPSPAADRRISVCDLDGDGDVDILVAREGDADIVSAMNRHVGAYALDPHIVGVVAEPEGFAAHVTYQRPAALGAGYDEFELLVWRQDLQGHLEIAPIQSESIPVTTDVFEIYIPNLLPIAAEVPGTYFLVQRFLKRVDGAAVDSSPVLLAVIVQGIGGSGGTSGTVDVPKLPCFANPTIPLIPKVNPTPP